MSYIQQAFKASFIDDNGDPQTVYFDNEEFLRARDVTEYPSEVVRNQKNVAYRYQPTDIETITWEVTFRVMTRETLDKIRGMLNRKVDFYPKYADVGATLDVVEINYGQLGYYDKNSYSGVVSTPFTTEYFRGAIVRKQLVSVVFDCFYRRVPEGIVDVTMTLRDLVVESYHSSYAISSITRGVSPDDQYTGRITTSASNDITDDCFVQVSDVTTSAWNGEWGVLSRKSATAFTISVPNSLTTPATVGSGVVVRKPFAIHGRGEVRFIVRDLDGGVYPIEVYLRNFAGRENEGDYLFAGYNSWKTNILGAATKMNLYVPYTTTDIETSADGIVTPKELECNPDFDYAESQGTETWYLFLEGTLSPTQYSEWVDALEAIGVNLG